MSAMVRVDVSLCFERCKPCLLMLSSCHPLTVSRCCAHVLPDSSSTRLAARRFTMVSCKAARYGPESSGVRQLHLELQRRKRRQHEKMLLEPCASLSLMWSSGFCFERLRCGRSCPYWICISWHAYRYGCDSNIRKQRARQKQKTKI